MCGICGVLGSSTSAEGLENEVRRMSDAIRHRGPDDYGSFVDPEAGLALGHRRLSIVDLSPHGHQPMASASGRWSIVFNGEIYNYRELRRELEGQERTVWRGHSDTEVMLAAISRWGLRASLERFNGMFAFALWDRSERTLFLARDRVGEKPLYYGWVGDDFLFASELKAFYAHPRWHGQIDQDALAMYFRYSCVPAPASIWQGVSKVMPGTFLTLRWSDGTARRPHAIDTYWSVRDVALRGLENRVQGSSEDAVEALDRLLRESVHLRMQADVPLGAFLSGGVDSSVVTALMQAQSSRPVRTFSIGFDQAEFNEAQHAAKVAAHLGTDHTELYVSGPDAIDTIPGLSDTFDEPFADASQIPTILVARLARRHVTVSLSGDGGDEVFAGYNRYKYGRSLWRMIRPIPPAGRRWIAGVVGHLPESGLEPLLRRMLGSSRLKHGADAIAEYLSSTDRFALYHRLVSVWNHPSELVRHGREPLSPIADPALRQGFKSFVDEMTALDLVGYLPNDILVKVDRATMAVSLEGRMPLLDHRVIEFAWRLPSSLKIREGRGKWALRQVLYRYVPPALVDRPKMGFGVPLDAWLRGPLRDWAESLLDNRRLLHDGLLQPTVIQTTWKEHLDRRSNRSNQLWAVLMFQQWLDTQRRASAAAA